MTDGEFSFAAVGSFDGMTDLLRGVSVFFRGYLCFLEAFSYAYIWDRWFGGEKDVDVGDLGVGGDRVRFAVVADSTVLDSSVEPPTRRNGLFHVGGDGGGNGSRSLCSLGDGIDLSSFCPDRLWGRMFGRLGHGLA